jgi:1-deoxy-D-xylulose-5-phosphate reductoisomerase
MKRVAIVGSTGSIGVSALEVARMHPERFSIDLLVAGRQAKALAAQIREFRPRVAGVADVEAFAELKRELGLGANSTRWEATDLVCGEGEISAAIKASQSEIVLAAVVGMVGLSSVIAALESGKDVALANKESLVVAGALVLEKAANHGAKLIPVDSEHSAIFQVLQGVQQEDVSSLILTASGGPFRTTPAAEFASITPEQALKHPQWSMGAKISIDSATMMNKALEVIEAHWLFDMAPEAIEVIVHPQSIVHSMVRLRDGTVLAQLSVPDMKGPIAYALAFPDGRLGSVMRPLDLVSVRELTFEPVDDERFPAVSRARACLRGAKGAAAVLNAANEVAVEAFLGRRIPFRGIFELVDEALDTFGHQSYETLDELRENCSVVTEWARHRTQSVRE